MGDRKLSDSGGGIEFLVFKIIKGYNRRISYVLCYIINKLQELSNKCLKIR